MKDFMIQIQNVSKGFLIARERVDTLREHAIHFFKPRTYDEFKAINQLSLDIEKGEFLGVIGRNGSGKSTLLKIIAGVLNPDKGKCIVHGVISPFLELGVGFQPELSGRENVFLYGILLGLSRSEIKNRYTSIVAFSELQGFMDMKVKNYSSGMLVRLAFSVAIQAEADIFLVDEALAVGDLSFQKKCLAVFQRFKKEKKTIVLVSHGLEAIKNFSDRVIILEAGKKIYEGGPDESVRFYKHQILETKL